MVVSLHDRKDFEFSQLLSKIEDGQSVSAQSQKKIKELQVCSAQVKLGTYYEVNDRGCFMFPLHSGSHRGAG